MTGIPPRSLEVLPVPLCALETHLSMFIHLKKPSYLVRNQRFGPEPSSGRLQALEKTAQEAQTISLWVTTRPHQKGFRKGIP